MLLSHESLHRPVQNIGALLRRIFSRKSKCQIRTDAALSGAGKIRTARFGRDV